MGTRVYVFLDIVDGKSEQVVKALRSNLGVAMADQLEGTPDVIVVVEASERQELAELTNKALASVEAMIEGVQLLPAQDELDSHAFAKTVRVKNSK
jgi:hypothetical protein